MRTSNRAPIRWAVLSGLLVAAACREPASPPVPQSADLTLGPAALTPAVAQALTLALPADSLFVIVQFDDLLVSGPVLGQQIMALGAGARPLQQLPFVGVLGTAAQIQAVAGLAGVSRVTMNRRLDYLSVGAALPAVAAILDDESVPTIKADQASTRYGVSGRGIGVVILDSGIDGLYQTDVQYPSRTVQNLKVVVNQRDVLCFTGRPCAGALYVEDLPNSETSVGHGTHVAGIAGGNGFLSGGLYPGVAPGANLIGIGTGDVLFIFFALAGFDYVLQNQDRYNIKVVNNSWGTSGPFDPQDPINVATERVTRRGITVVFAAGNEGPGENTLNPYSVAPWVIGVAAACSATDTLAQQLHCEGGMLADFSSRGIPDDPLYHPTVTAPGVHVLSARASTGTVLNALDANHDFDLTSTCGLRLEFAASYTCASGTSMAAPHVAGVVALMQERARGGLTPARVRQILVQTAVPLAGRTAFEAGAGMVDALAAVGRSR